MGDASDPAPPTAASGSNGFIGCDSSEPTAANDFIFVLQFSQTLADKVSQRVTQRMTKPQSSSTPDDAHQDIHNQALDEQEMTKEKDLLSPENGGNAKKGRGLLHVPSRSSSQRNQQPSPTTTGLSGVTVSESRNSIGGHSKESKSSMLGRQRNGSASSQRSGVETEPTNTPGNSLPASPVSPPQKKKKSGGLLSLLGCCAAPDHPNGLDEADGNVHKLSHLPTRPTTSKSRQNTPQDQPSTSKTQLQEKEPQNQLQTTQESKGKRVSGTSTQDQSTVGGHDTDSKLVNSTAPAVRVEPPQGKNSENVPVEESKDDEGDIPMRDAETETPAQSKQPQVPSPDDPITRTIPPPPPGPAPIANPPMPAIHEGAGPSAPPEPKALLPPIAPEHKGRKCLVLDLDETLVHSSFKVRMHNFYNFAGR